MKRKLALFILTAIAMLAVPAVRPVTAEAVTITASGKYSKKIAAMAVENTYLYQKKEENQDAIVTAVPAGAVLDIRKTYDGGWYKVKFGRDTGYIHGKYLTDNTILAFTRTYVNVRQTKSLKSLDNIVTTLKENTVVDLLGPDDGTWTKVKYNGKIGYILSKYITSYTDCVRTMKDDLNVRSSMDKTADNIVGALRAGSQIVVYSREPGGWYKIRYNGKTAYIKVGHFEEEDPDEGLLSNDPDTDGLEDYDWDYESYELGEDEEVGYPTNIIAEDLNLRSSMDKSGRDNIVTVIPKGGEVQLLSHEGEWWHVIYDDHEGYVVEGHFENDTSNMVFQPEAIRVLQEDMALRYEKNTDKSKIIMTIAKGEKVSVLRAEEYGWYRVWYEGITGFVRIAKG